MRMTEDKQELKDEFVELKNIFTNIASHYDNMNRIISLGLDSLWRKKAVKLLNIEPEAKILELGCGTCELTIELEEKINEEGQIIALDCNPQMLELGRRKIKEKRLGQKINLIKGDARDIPFIIPEFDYVGIAFTLRNIPERLKVLQEMKRVTKSGGVIFSLDIFEPTLLIYRQLFLYYFNHIIPYLGKVIFNQHQEYNWLPQSLKRFITIKKLKNILAELNLAEIKVETMMLGAIARHCGKK